MTAFLRPWRADDAAALLSARRSSSDLDAQFGDAQLEDEARAAAYIHSSLRFDDVFKNWAIVVDDVAVGNVGLAHIERRHDTAWAHYWLAAGARGHGYASRALATVAERAFADGLFRLELGHRVNNPASCLVATAAGFAAEGLERQKLRYGSERFDVETHARLAIDPVPATRGLTVAT